jgi:lysophospholipid acyltransferase
MRLIRGQYDSTGVQAKDAQPYRVSAQLTWRPALFRFFEGLAHAVSYLALSVYFPVSYLLSREFQEYSWSFSALFYRLIVIYITMQGFKAKLYLAWAWAEGSLIMMGARWKLVDNAGAKHKSADGQVSLPTKDLLFDYGDVDNFSYRGLELASSFQAIIRNWNISTHHWLKYYVYVRVIEVYKAGSLVVDAKVPSSIISLATLSTFVMSAFWHGFYSGYYLTFVT